MTDKITDSNGNVIAEVLGIVETNPHCDERLSSNGANSQPTTVCRWNDWTIAIADTSLGRFGTRISVNAHQRDTDRELAAYWGTMVPEKLRQSQFSYADRPMLDDIYRLTKYDIPTADQLNWD